ncbi:restriction endonuclease subunit S [Mycoplasmopsis primatum]|uniref:restriction endonuclease subunit S n=1 Tax=Mycoplasmopsis primatum TaxID=55604 RepID=UPI00068E6EDD|nr:restriction endonuclease subunit S [Mycoplasmopsis primatum]
MYFIVEYEKIKDICKVYKGTQLNKSKLHTFGEFPVINGGKEPSGYWNQYNFNENNITISQGGASAGYVDWQKNKFWAGAHCYVCISNDKKINNKFLFYVLKNNENKLQQKQYGAGIPSLGLDTLQDIQIPIPHISVQNKIVEILDKLETYTKDIKSGLPLEIKQRHQQYEYYLNKLFEFDKKS